MTYSPKGQVSTLDNPCNSKIMLWLRDVALPYHGDDCLIFPFGRARDGYCNVGRQGKSIKVHRLLCQRIHGDPPTPKHHAAHSCGNGHLGCVNPRHLSWKTPSENFLEGQQHPRYKLNAAKVAEIRASNELAHVLAPRYGVTEATIRKVKSGKLWPTGLMTHAGVPTRRQLAELNQS